jgi:GNAT superfamily N-acetyltransferase
MAQEQLKFSQVRTDDGSLEAYSSLLRTTFPHAAARFSDRYLDWLYRRNPEGAIVGFDAWDGGRLAAHYVCMPIAASVGGREVRALLSLNTATHPEYQGRGLFTKLANRTYADAGGAAYAAVVGVANANSTPGFIKKLGFQLVRPLSALVGVGPLRGFRVTPMPRDLDFRRSWTTASLAWRLENPNGPVTLLKGWGGMTAFSAPTHVPGVVAWTEHDTIADQPAVRSPQIAERLGRLFLGITPPSLGLRSGSLYAELPAQLRPAPLNLIYRRLGEDGLAALQPDRIFFDFLDFDAF